MNRLGRFVRVWARSMKRKGLQAKSWEQRSCGVGLGLGREFLGEGRSISDFSCWGIFVLLNISLSRVKEIVRKIRVEFQNGNEGLGIGSQRSWKGGHPGRFGLPPFPQKARKEWGTLLLYVVQSCAWNGWATLALVSGKPVTSGGLGSHPFRTERGKDGAPFFYV
jgi:hypothetical protein